MKRELMEKTPKQMTGFPGLMEKLPKTPEDTPTEKKGRKTKEVSMQETIKEEAPTPKKAGTKRKVI